MEETLGQYLKRKRESRLISLQEISHSTSISIPLIKALEDDNFSSFPDPKIIAEYLKKCASYLRLNEKHVLRRYQTQSDQNHQTRHWPQLSLFSGGNTSFEQTAGEKRLFKKRNIRVILWLSYVILLIVVFSLCILVLSPKEESTEVQKTSTSKYTGKELPYERNDRVSSVVVVKTETSPIRDPESSGDRSIPTPSHNFVSVDSYNSAKESGAQARNVPHSPGKAKVIGNRDSKRYHLPGMKYYDKVKSYHRISFNSEAEALKAGYSKAHE
jgi:cytoskeletal protein RodZ